LAKAQLSSSPFQNKEKGPHGVLLVLVIEDNPSDVYLIRSAIEASGLKTSIAVQQDGAAATNFFDEIDRNAVLAVPGLIILDLNLPKLSGIEVLEHMRRSPRCQKAVVIVVSTSALDAERKRISKLGADAYFRKPSEFDEFMKLGEVIRVLFP
jgi:chemotaxis family two-component system response regulator Rcp1